MSASWLVDSHCHLDGFGEDDRIGVIERAGEAGVRDLVTISTRIRAIDKLIGIARSATAGVKVWCTVGTHPDHVGDDPRLDGQAIAALVSEPEIVGIGESGLDFASVSSDRSLQADRFKAHIEAARITNLPLVIHSRAADAAMATFLMEEQAHGAFSFVMHCFSAGPALAATAIGCGGYVSFSGILTFSNAEALRALARTLPANRILIETDAPFLAPVPQRGRRNEPAFVVHTSRVLGKVLGLSEKEVAEQTTRNFRQLFRKAA